MANLVLARLRQRGVNFGGSPNNQPGDFDPPAEVLLALANGYNWLLRATQDFRIATIDVDFLTVAGATSYALNPLPVGAGATNQAKLRPAMMRVYEWRYILGSGATATIERYRPILSTEAFRRLTGGYQMRYGASAQYPYAATQQFGLRRLDVYPATSVAGDTIRLFGVPDPMATERALPGGQVPCSAGGAMTNGSDVPLVPEDSCMAIVHYTTALLCEQADKIQQGERERALAQAFIDELEASGAANGEGAPEQVVDDPYARMMETF